MWPFSNRRPWNMHERKKELKQIAFAFIISLCLLVGAASANILVNFPEEQMNGSVGYTCFEVLPPWLAETFQNRMRSGDRIIGGMVRYENAGNPSEQTCSGIVALQRDSRIILYGLSQNHPGIGQVRAETDVFLSPEDDFEFLPLRVLNPDGRMTQVELGVRKGNQVLSLNVEDGKIAISQCLTLQGETGTLLLSLGSARNRQDIAVRSETMIAALKCTFILLVFIFDLLGLIVSNLCKSVVIILFFGLFHLNVVNFEQSGEVDQSQIVQCAELIKVLKIC